MNDGRPTHLDLFSGIGGFALAARWAGFRTIGFCEIDKYCQRVIAKNFLADATQLHINGSGANPESGSRQVSESGERSRACRIWPDIRQLRGSDIGCNVTLLTGGFPCQPFSCAGKRKGTADDRHLWPEMLRVINEARPAWVLGENVAGIIGMELDTVLSDLEAIGYACRPFVIPACGVDARHRRNRVWIVANAAFQQGSPGNNGAEPGTACGTQQSQLGRSNCRAMWERNWQLEPDVGRVAHGIPSRVDRLRGLGNAIVPQVAFQILKAIREQIGNEALQTPNSD